MVRESNYHKIEEQKRAQMISGQQKTRPVPIPKSRRVSCFSFTLHSHEEQTYHRYCLDPLFLGISLNQWLLNLDHRPFLQPQAIRSHFMSMQEVREFERRIQHEHAINCKCSLHTRAHYWSVWLTVFTDLSLFASLFRLFPSCDTNVVTAFHGSACETRLLLPVMLYLVCSWKRWSPH